MRHATRFNQRWFRLGGHGLNRRAGGGGDFDPTAMSGLIAMLHAPWEGGNEPAALTARAQNLAIAPGDPVQTATDWSPNGNHFTQSTLSLRPTWESGSLAGVAGSHYFDFDGSDDRWTASLDFTKLLLIAVVDRGVSNPRFLFHYGTPLAFNTMYSLAQTSSTGIAKIRGASGSEYGLNGVWATGGGIDVLKANFVPDVPSMYATIDGVDITTGSVGTAIALAGGAQTFDLGSRNGGFAWDGAMGTVMLFNPDLVDGDELVALDAWIATQWS